MPADQATMTAYGESFGRFVTQLSGPQLQNPGDPGAVSDAIVTLIETPEGKRPHRTVVAPAPQTEALQALNTAAAETARTVSADMGVADFLKL